ncbi:MAG: sensor histidine kinase [Acidobacteria bacterium]|nr:sensor histidine kinase [Acidobacteriota bacterium]
MIDSRIIRARIHNSALKRVTRAFSATLADIFAETLQNARRAGATGVNVVLGEHERDGGPTVTVLDDGTGIADPAVLLSFGENGWSGDLVEREDAAGMGLLSLARRGCAVSSRPPAPGDAPTAGWLVELVPEHFAGDASAEVRPEAGAPYPHGTAVRFPAMEAENADRIRGALEAAAIHYPLPVYWGRADRSPGDAEALPRRAFLDGAVHVERWRGLVFGVFRNRPHRFGLNDPDVNFHGLTVAVRLPGVETVGGARWSVAADIEDCPELQFVLPARKEAVETPFLAEMREAARRAIYRALAADPDPRPSFGDWTRAREADIGIEPPPAELRPWLPAVADLDRWHESRKLQPVPPDALIVACDPEPPEAQTFRRAAGRNGLAPRLFEPDCRLEGYGWYDAIPRIAAIRTEVEHGGTIHALEDWPVPERSGGTVSPEPRPEAIRIVAAVRPSGQPDRLLGLPTDLAFAGEAWAWVGDARPLVTADSALDPGELADLLYAAFFSPSDDADADSWERQQSDFQAEALHLATRLLVSDNEARRRSIADAVRRELLWLIPRERSVHIAVRDGRVAVTLGAPAAESAR